MAEFLDVNVDTEFLGAWMVGPTCRRILEERGHTAAMLFQAEVAKDSGDLAASAHVHTEVGGAHHDRLVADLTIGGIGAKGTVDYGAAHQFGRGDKAGSIHNLDGKTIVQDGSHILNRVAEQLGSI